MLVSPTSLSFSDQHFLYTRKTAVTSDFLQIPAAVHPGALRAGKDSRPLPPLTLGVLAGFLRMRLYDSSVAISFEIKHSMSWRKTH